MRDMKHWQNIIHEYWTQTNIFIKYDRYLKRYFIDIAVTFTNYFNRQNQHLLKLIVGGILKATTWKYIQKFLRT